MDITQSNLTLDDLPPQTSVKIVAEVVDHSFYFGETGTVLEHTPYGVKVHLHEPRFFQDGSYETGQNFDPKDLVRLYADPPDETEKMNPASRIWSKKVG